MAEFGILKIGDLYRQQLRLYAWKFWKNKLPENQTVLLSKVSDVHRHQTRSADLGLFVKTQDHRSVGYRVPKEWDSVPKVLRDISSLSGFKKKSKDEFIMGYKRFICDIHNCYVCGRSAGLD